MTDIEVTDDAPAALIDRDLINHLCRSSQLTAKQAEHLVTEVLSYFSQTPEEFLRARHQELQAQGYDNSAIYTALHTELSIRRFGAKPFTTRQIRRAIYG